MTHIMVNLLYHIAKCLTLIYMAQPGANTDAAIKVSNDFCELTNKITAYLKDGVTK